MSVLRPLRTFLRAILDPTRMASRTRRQPTRILIARHGQTLTNVDGRFCGHSETDLTDLGRAQASALGARLAALEIHAAYSSDFSRAAETARLVLGERRVPVNADPALRELHYGDWELRKGSDVARRWPEEFRRMRAEDPAWCPPGGESIASVRERTVAALRRIAAEHHNQTVLVISHGTAINCMLGEVLGTSHTHTFRFDVWNCGLSEVRASGSRLVVTTLNDISHLSGLPRPGAEE